AFDAAKQPGLPFKPVTKPLTEVLSAQGVLFQGHVTDSFFWEPTVELFPKSLKLRRNAGGVMSKPLSQLPSPVILIGFMSMVLRPEKRVGIYQTHFLLEILL